MNTNPSDLYPLEDDEMDEIGVIEVAPDGTLISRLTGDVCDDERWWRKHTSEAPKIIVERTHEAYEEVIAEFTPLRANSAVWYIMLLSLPVLRVAG